MGKAKITAEKRAFLIANYATNGNKELAAILGVDRNTVTRTAKLLGLEKDRDYMHNVKVRTGGMTSTKGKIPNTKEVIEKRTATRMDRYRTDRARVLFGLEQKTRMKIGLEPRAKQTQRRYLKSRGYIIEEASRTAFWTPETIRCTRIEARPKQWYNFRPIEEKMVV